MKKILILLGLILSVNLYAQTHEEKKILEVIDELFDGYRAGDSSRVAAVFPPSAKVQTIYATPEGDYKITDSEPITAFIEYIGAGFSELHDERIWDTKIHSDALLATVWTKYAFFLGDVFSHCGTETFLLRKDNHEWKIFYLVDTRQKAGCKLPDEINK